MYFKVNMVPARFSLYFLVMLFSACCGHIGGEISLQNVSPQVYCGRTLARVMAMICYNSPNDFDKRSDAATMYGSMLTPYYKEKDSQLGWPWMPAHRARSMEMPSRGKRQFIVNECCEKACSISELMPYC